MSLLTSNYLWEREWEGRGKATEGGGGGGLEQQLATEIQKRAWEFSVISKGIRIRNERKNCLEGRPAVDGGVWKFRTEQERKCWMSQRRKRLFVLKQSCKSMFFLLLLHFYRLKRSQLAEAERLCLCRVDNRTNCTLGQIRHTWRKREREGERRRRLQLCRVWFQLACSTIPLCLSLGPQSAHENVRSVLACAHLHVCVYVHALWVAKKKRQRLFCALQKNVHGASHCDSLSGRRRKRREKSQVLAVFVFKFKILLGRVQPFLQRACLFNFGLLQL